MKKILIYVFAAMLLSGVAVSTQSCKTAKMRDADEAFDRGEYNDAANIYRKVYNKLRKRDERWMRGEVAFKMGLCYRKLSQSARASAAFQNALRYEYEDSMAYFYLAQAQQMEGQYKNAMQNYEEFLKYVPNHELSLEGIRACRMAPKWKEQSSRYQVKAARLFNSRRADFCPMYLDASQEVLYFTSSTEKATGTTKSEITGTKNCDIFFSKKNDKGQWQRPEPAGGELNTEFDEGITAFTPNGSTMYLAKAIRKPSSGTSVEIYKSQRSEAQWSAATKVEITADTLSAFGDPAVSPDGKYLYFASDMPGGYGGIDLWRVAIDGTRGTLENLGEQINTPGNERFPYWRNDTTLYFSSDGHAGFGGLDLFKAVQQPSGRWFIENMGEPMNSSADDFGITFGTGEEGFFSSNRKDARGYDHIYSFVKPDLKIWISGYVLDKDEEPVPNAIIRIVGDDGSNQKAVAKPDGSFRFDLQRGVSYVMLAGANGYLNGKQQFTSDIAEEDAEYNVDFILAAMHKPQVIENIFYDFNKATLRPESKTALNEMVQIMRDNPYITIEMASHTDRVGSDQYNIKLSERRAQSVVDYLVAHGVERARLQPKGYGKQVPKIVTKRINRLYPQFNEGDTLTVAYVDTLSKENKAVADQINRRTEFQVLTTDFKPFTQDQEEYDAEKARRQQALDFLSELDGTKKAAPAATDTVATQAAQPDSVALPKNLTKVKGPTSEKETEQETKAEKKKGSSRLKAQKGTDGPLGDKKDGPLIPEGDKPALPDLPDKKEFPDKIEDFEKPAPPEKLVKEPDGEKLPPPPPLEPVTAGPEKEPIKEK